MCVCVSVHAIIFPPSSFIYFLTYLFVYLFVCLFAYLLVSSQGEAVGMAMVSYSFTQTCLCCLVNEGNGFTLVTYESDTLGLY